MRRLSLAAFLVCIAVSGGVAAGEVTYKDFETFANSRFGPPDGKARYWYGVGPMRDAATGKTLYRFEYYDTVRHYVDPKDPNRRFGIVRKLDLFRDAKTNDLLTTFNGKHVESWIFPYQLFELQYKDGAVSMSITQGSGKFLRTHVFPDIEMLRHGDNLHITIPGFFTVRRPEIPDAVQAFTMSSLFVVCERNCSGSPQVDWVQAGVNPAPPWAESVGEGLLYMFMSGTRFEQYADLPQSLRTVIDAQYPEWREPAKDLAEIEALQR